MFVFCSCTVDSVQKGNQVFPADELHCFKSIYSLLPVSKPLCLASLVGNGFPGNQPSCRVPVPGHGDLHCCA